MKLLGKSSMAFRYRINAARAVKRLRSALFAPPYPWETLSDPSLTGAAGQYEEARTELVDLIRGAPRRLIDLGCGNGATAAAIKARFPLADVIGVEQNPVAAQVAASRLDRIIVASLENLDYGAHGLGKQSIDAVLLLDVLEHLYDPWDVLRRLHPCLATNAQLVASIPNARNYWLLSRLLGDGEFTYEQNGLLDITHIRFFTRREIEKMFVETGYRITAMFSHYDERVPEDFLVNKAKQDDFQKFVLLNLADDDVKELRTLQFYVVASPV